jgi:hypothetical protein
MMTRNTRPQRPRSRPRFRQRQNLDWIEAHDTESAGEPSRAESSEAQTRMEPPAWDRRKKARRS